MPTGAVGREGQRPADPQVAPATRQWFRLPGRLRRRARQPPGRGTAGIVLSCHLRTLARRERTGTAGNCPGNARNGGQ